MIEAVLIASLFFDANGNHTISTYLKGYYPPMRYDYPFPGRVYVMWESPETLQTVCPTSVVACVIDISYRSCTIAISSEWKHRRDDILRHENGHCNGWPASHPQR